MVVLAVVMVVVEMAMEIVCVEAVEVLELTRTVNPSGTYPCVPSHAEQVQ